MPRERSMRESLKPRCYVGVVAIRIDAATFTKI